MPAGFKVSLFAAEPDLANPVAFSIDERGRFFVAETFRLHAGVTDIRGHMNWLDDDLANRTTEDLAALFKKYLGEKAGSLTNNSERIKLLEDRDHDGKIDHSQIFAENFNSMVEGLGAGLLARKGEVYFTSIPNLWLLQDKNRDGKAESRRSLSYGYGVRVGFLGHDLHGLIFGPDGKLYFSIGDRGANVRQKGNQIGSPETGAVFRCDPDGSNLEVFAFGLRNPQELAFDDYGNLFTGDNNSDGGDQARWVYLVEGGDSGWRIGWQFIEKPNSRGPWNAEKMWHPRWSEQPAHLVPPIANITSGPSGLTYYPGTGLNERYRGHFFLCDFKGSAANSLVHAFSLKPRGATFEITNRHDFISGVLVTDCEFGTDGALYISDWVEGWAMPGKGRLYRIASVNDDGGKALLDTRKLIAEGMDHRRSSDLAQWLKHPDKRVRQEAQFALVNQRALKELIHAAQQTMHPLARVHAVWGLGQMAGKNLTAGERKRISRTLIALLKDHEPEVRAQSAKIIGNARFQQGESELLKCLQDAESRVKFFAALSLGKLGNQKCVPALLELLRVNDNRDAYLRHAGVVALAGLNDLRALRSASKDPSSAVRLAALLALRRLQSPDVRVFLTDQDSFVRLEAARAIYDQPIPEAMPDLARIIETMPELAPLSPLSVEAFYRRVINANFRVGTGEAALSLAKFTADSTRPEKLRAEGLEALREWKKPAGRDRVVGLWRPLPERDPQPVIAAARPILETILKTAPGPVRLAAVRLADDYQINEVSPALRELVADNRAPNAARIEALKVLASRQDPKLDQAIKIAAADSDEGLRKEATRLLAKTQPADAISILRAVLEKGSIGEKQNAMAALGGIKSPEADHVLSDWLDTLIAGKVPSELHLELIEAAAKREALKEKVAKWEGSFLKEDALAPHRVALNGGNAEEGKKIFFERAEVSCLRCHRVGEEGGDVGPVLTRVGAEKTREYLLESIVLPNKAVAPGFETLLVTLKNGTSYAGQLKSEAGNELIINSPEDGIVKIRKEDIESRDRGLSGMPEELAHLLSKKDLRDLIEYLASLR